MLTWRLIPYIKGTAAWNMAVDEAVLEGFLTKRVPPTLRFYGWSEESVTIGRLQTYESIPKGWGGQVVRRPTGGRAVDHRNDLLTFSIVVGAETLGSPIRESYRRVGSAVSLALSSLGVDASFCWNTTRPRAVRQISNCFNLTLEYELSVSGQKVLGSAQVRRSGAVLQQNSLSLAGVLNCPDCASVAEAIVHELAAEFGVLVEVGELSGFELQIARQLTDNKYAADAWNKPTATSVP